MASRAPLQSRLARVSTRHGQKGVVMFVALVVLIVMTLAGLAMLRQMTSGVSIAGNIAFKQGATAVADAGVEAGRTWIGANPTLLDNNQPAGGYYATWGTNFDPASAYWATNMWATAPVLPAASTGNVGNTVKYVIERLCSLPGAAWGQNMPPTQQCSDSVGGSTDGTNVGGVSYSNPGPATRPAAPYYRVTTQVSGPRNTVSYTQVVLN